jgi:iron(III) transport system permease protein
MAVSVGGPSSRPRGGGWRPRPSRPLLGAAVAVAAWSALPLVAVVIAWLQVGPGRLATLLLRPRIGDLLGNTLGLIAVTVPLCVVLGVVAAWIVERTTMPGRRIAAVLFAAPLAIPAFVNSYAWVSAVPSLSGLGAGVLITTLSYYPFVYLPVAATLRRLDPSLDEAGAALGLGPARVLVRVTLPQLRLPILGGALLIGLHLLAEYAAFAMVRFETFTTAIMTQYRASFGGPVAYGLAGVLVACCLVLLAADAAARGSVRYARIGSGAPRPAPRTRSSAVIGLAIAATTLLLALALGVPAWSLVRWGIAGGATAWGEQWIVPAVAGSVALGLVAAVLCGAAALPVALLGVRYPSGTSRLLEGVQYVASSLPGIAVALVLVTVAVSVARPVYQTVPLLLGAYALLFLPRALVSLRAGLAQVPVALEETARSLGVSPSRAFLRVTGRIALPAALAGGALVFLGVVTELTATLLLAPNGARTLAMQFWTHTNDLDYGRAAPYAVLMVLVSLPVTLLLFRSSHLGRS